MDKIRICRLCGISGSNMNNFFTKDSTGVQYLTKIKECIPILIYRTDPLSKFICQSCSTSLSTFYKFQLMTLDINKRAVNKLREVTNNNGVQLFLNALDNDSLPIEETNPPPIYSRPGPASSKIHNAVSSHSRAYNSTLKRSPLKILTPNNINNTIIQPLDEPAKIITEDATVESPIKLVIKSEPIIYQPLNLLQCALHSINLTINPNYQRPDDDTPPPTSNSSEYETHYMSNKRKRTLDDSLPMLSELLHSSELGLKRIKLESDDPYSPEISISLQDTEISTYYSTPGLHIKLNYPKRKCKYCSRMFGDINELAAHEISHIHVFMGARVDSHLWKDYEENMIIRNKWLEDDEMDAEDGDGYQEDEHTNDTSEENELPVQIKQEITDELAEDIISQVETIIQVKPHEIVNHSGEMDAGEEDEGPSMERATVHGRAFNLLTKQERFKYYKEVYVDGIKRRQCPFCKSTFKDIWASDNHFIKNRCIRICKFCQKSFKKDDLEYFEHVSIHSHEPNFAALTKNDKKQFEMQVKKNMYREKKLQTHDEPIRVEPIKMKYLFEKQNYMTVIKAEPGTSILKTRLSNKSPSEMPSKHHQQQFSGTKQSRTYYCRKCYKVFYNQTDLDVHYSECYDSSELSDEEQFSTDKSQITSSQTVKKKIVPIKAKILQCHICKQTFPNIHARNSHMRVHKTKIIPNTRYPIMQSHSQLHPQPQPPDNTKSYIIQPIMRNTSTPPTKTITKPPIMDENLARLVQNPHITIRPSNVIHQSSQPPPPQQQQSHINHSPSSHHPTTMLHHSIFSPNDTSPPPQPPPPPQSTNIPHSERNYRCLPCGQYFPTKSVMYVHKKSECSVAPATGYVTLDEDVTSNSAQHAAMNGRKNYRCLPCNKKFNSKTSLYLHKKNVCNRVKVFECPFCKRKFSTESQYTTHILFNHPE